MIPALAVVAALAFAAVGDAYDIIKTREVITKGLGVEGNTWLIGKKPSAVALALRDSFSVGMFLAPCVLGAFYGIPTALGAIVVLAVFGIKHIHGGVINQSVLNGKPVPDPYRNKTAWEKFLDW